MHKPLDARSAGRPATIPTARRTRVATAPSRARRAAPTPATARHAVRGHPARGAARRAVYGRACCRVASVEPPSLGCLPTSDLRLDDRLDIYNTITSRAVLHGTRLGIPNDIAQVTPPTHCAVRFIGHATRFSTGALIQLAKIVMWLEHTHKDGGEQSRSRYTCTQSKQ